MQEKVAGKVLILDRALEDILPYLFALLGVSDPTSSLQQMDPQIRRRRTFDAIKRLLVRESLKQPLILIFEDLHWLDNETQAFLLLLSESVATARILLLVNYRPEYRHEWGSKTYYTQLRLDSLGQDNAQELLTALVGDGAALHSLKQFILEKTEGNPFFMEEMVQALVEQGVLVRDAAVGAGLRPAPTVKPAIDLHIPPTVQGVLAARIDRLPPEEKALLQTLAVIGKEFPLGLLKQVVPQSEDELQRVLAHLQGGEFIYERPAFPEIEYVFKHALTQEVAYNSLLLERRKGVHERTAQAIEEVYRYRLEEHYSELAHHYSRSGNTRKAVEYLGLAGQQAVQRSAHAEAINHLTTVLELLKTLPDTPARAQQELQLQIALGPALIVTKGRAAQEAERAYMRARELCQQLGDPPQIFPVLYGLATMYAVRAELQKGRELAEQLLHLAQSEQDPGLLLIAHCRLGTTLSWLGEWVPAREHIEQGIALYNPQRHHALTFFYGGLDPGVSCLSRITWPLWYLGYPDQAFKRSQAALTLAQELSHPHSPVLALALAAVLHQNRWEVQAVQERAEAVMTLASEQGFPDSWAWAMTLRGWALAEQGQEEEGLKQMQQGLAAVRSTGSELLTPYFFVLLAEVYGKMGQPEEGLAVLAESLEIIHKTQARFHEAEGYRVKGQLTLQKFQVSGSKFQVENPQSAIRNPQSAIRNWRPKRAFTRRLRLPANRRRDRWSCGRR